ncbi:MAG: ABC transporter substrate-binding protein, partial [Conexivisphaera sp.]
MRRKAASAMVVLAVIAVIAVVASSVYVGYQVSLYSSRISSLESSLQSLNRTLSAQASALSSLYSQQQSIEASLSSLYSQQQSIEVSLNFPAVAVDATGQQIVVYSMPTRIVSLMPSDTALLFAVGAGPQVVGVDKYSNWPPYLQALESNGTIKDIGSGWYPDPEVILSARPDIVFGVSSVPSNYALKQQFAAYGIPVVLLPDNTIEDV